MAITFNTTWANIRGCAYYDASAATDVLKHTVRGTQDNVYNVDLFPDTGMGVGDAFIFAVNYNYGKCNQIRLNLDVGIAGTDVTGVWEYCVGGTNGAPNYSALSVISDGTAGLTATGLQTLSFNVPDDWDNFHLTGVSINLYYCFLIRYRITGFTTWTEGGHIANVSNNCQSLGYTIFVDGYTSGTPCTLTDIYNASVAGGWGVVTKLGNQFSFACNLWNSSNNYITTQNEQIQFENNWFLMGTSYSKWLIGKVYSGDKVWKGSSFVFLGSNVNYPSNAGFGSDSKIYNAQFRNIKLSSTIGFNGYWGGGIGDNARQSVADVYIEGFRQVAFRNTQGGVLGVKFQNQIENQGAIIANCVSFGGSFGWRCNSLDVDTHIHNCDFSKVSSNPLNPYLNIAVNNKIFNCIDCDFGTFTYANYASWYYGNGTGNRVKMKASVLLKIVDEAGSAISGATVEVKDKDGNIAFSYLTNTDGYPGQESGAMTGATSASISDTSKAWTLNLWRFKEVFITSGAGIGQRRYIPAHTTSPYTTLPLVPDFQTTPATNDRYIIIPYVEWLRLKPTVENLSGTTTSTPTDYNPFTLTISKPGYETYEKVMTITKKIDEVISLKTAIDIRDGLEGENYLALNPELGSSSDIIEV